MPKLTIDGIEIEVEKGTSILQACEQLGKEIPRFCYHDKLSVPANCRMCLVEMEKAPKLVASCAMPCGDGMIIHTGSDKVKKGRKGVMEMLLINHPLDCPICDQAGECDLQDQSVAYGFDRSRYAEAKRAVKDKELGPLVKTIMTRCIHCTRCIRFGEEIAGVEQLGILNRGNDVEIGTYIEAMIESELSGNLVDVCPVGALTNKPYAYKARPWELRKTETIDVLDAVGSNIRVDARGDEVMRILPRLHEEVNEEWISDKTRYSLDGLRYQRLDRPYVRNNKGKLEAATWEEAFDVVYKKLQKVDGKEIAAIAGDLADCESMKALKDFMDEVGCTTFEARLDGAEVDMNDRSSYIFNSGIAGIEKADAILLVGTNPRHEATMVNARIRKAFLLNKAKIGLVHGDILDLTYDYEYLGAGTETLEALIKDKDGFAKTFKEAKNPMIILGAGALNRNDAMAVQDLASTLLKKANGVREDWNGYNILHTAASRVGAFDLGFVSKNKKSNLKTILKDIESKKTKFVYLLNADDFDVKALKNAFVVYQGHHGDAAALVADVILPGVAYTEKNATYVNTEGRVQRTKQAVHTVGEAKEDWKIIRALAEYCDVTLPYNSLFELRAEMEDTNAVFENIDCLVASPFKGAGEKGTTLKQGFVSPITNYYQTNSISRASKVMAECVQTFLDLQEKKTGTK